MKRHPLVLGYSCPIDVCRAWCCAERSKRVVRTDISRVDDLNRRKAGASHDRVEWESAQNELKIRN